MNILMWHGYLLTGTGSNIYVRDLVAQLVKKGHHVTLLCQEPNPEAIDFISEAHEFLPDNQTFKEVFKRSTPYPGSCRFYKPNLGGFLPVYVWDHYDGYAVKEFHDLTQPELDRYIEQNRASVEKLLVENRIETIYTNHTVMSPYVFSLVAPKYKVPYFVVIHGSCLNYTVRKEERYMSYAVKGLDGASGVVVVSQYMADEVRKVLSDRIPGLDRKIKIIPCGVDVDAFAIPGDGKETNIRQVREVLRGTIKEKPNGRNRVQMEEFQKSLASVKDKRGLRELVLAHREKYNY
ncbi:MAG: glycosyltransferase, partial [Armatimonadetes bacterium]|nr:glycosyltransferase [Armatimonadota bacterium]